MELVKTIFRDLLTQSSYNKSFANTVTIIVMHLLKQPNVQENKTPSTVKQSKLLCKASAKTKQNYCKAPTITVKRIVKQAPANTVKVIVSHLLKFKKYCKVPTTVKQPNVLYTPCIILYCKAPAKIVKVIVRHLLKQVKLILL